jgi:hypothetical protein
MTQSRDTGGATVDGRLLQAVVDGVVESTGHFEDRTRTLLVDHGLDADPDAGTAYPLGAFRDLLATIGRETGPNTLDRIGRATARALAWPPHVRTVADALETLDSAAERYHTGVSLRCSFVRTGAHAGRVDVETPYSEAFERGLLAGVGAQFGYGPGHVTVRTPDVRTDGGRSSGRELALAWSVDPAAETSIPAPSAD